MENYNEERIIEIKENLIKDLNEIKNNNDELENYLSEVGEDEFANDEEDDIITLLSADGEEIDFVVISGIAHKGNFYPHLRRKIEKSWSRVFTQMNVGNEMLVATTWELRKEWIREVRFYEAMDITES